MAFLFFKPPHKHLPPEEFSSSRLLDRLLPFFDDPLLDEILVNGTHSLSLVYADQLRTDASPFNDPLELATWLQDFALDQQVRLDPLCATAGGVLRGSQFRWHALLPPLSVEGPLFSLRRHRFDSLGLADFEMGDADREILRNLLRQRCNLLVAGPTGSGKSTLLAALLAEAAARERVVIIEALQELPLKSSAWVRLLERAPNLEGTGGVTLRRLVQESLRLRPDRIVLGEIRADEAAAFVEAGLAGHSGLIATIHGSSRQDALLRLRLLARYNRKAFSHALATLESELGVVMLERGRPPKVVRVEAPDKRP